MRRVVPAVVVVLAGLAGAIYAQTPAATQVPAAASKKLLFLTHAGLYKHTSLGPAEYVPKSVGCQSFASILPHPSASPCCVCARSAFRAVRLCNRRAERRAPCALSKNEKTRSCRHDQVSSCAERRG